MIVIHEEKCTGCGICVKVCPTGALSMVSNIARLEEDKCTLCGSCVSSCPFGAITMERKAQTVDVSAYRDIWVFAEQDNGVLKSVVLELLGKGRDLAEELGQRLCAVLVGSKVDHLIPELAAHGADVVYLVEDDIFGSYSTQAYTAALATLISRHQPNILLYGATHKGRDLAPSVAANLGLGLTADCTGLSIEPQDKLLLQTRPAFGGNLMADIICPNTRPQMATVRSHVMKSLEAQPGRTCDVVREDIEVSPRSITTKILEVISSTTGGEKKVEEANIVVSGGRGLGSEKGFQLVKNLAEALGGAVGCSRGAVEAGWMSKTRQVGQSGKTVSPELYIAIGISGCIQHVVGMRSSRVIIAINNDSAAPILEVADLGVVGDLFEIVPALTEAIKAR
jgi:electron transfer flavoprotein alpha subunit